MKKRPVATIMIKTIMTIMIEKFFGAPSQFITEVLAYAL